MNTMRFEADRSFAIDHAIGSVEAWLERAHATGIGLVLADYRAADTLRDALVAARLPFYHNALRCHRNVTWILIYLEHLRDRYLLLCAEDAAAIERLGFEGYIIVHQGRHVQVCTQTPHNTDRLHQHVAHTNPTALCSLPVGDRMISIGLGDRLGIAGFGHIAVADAYGAVPVLAQQSKRELALTGRTYADVVQQASWDVFAYGYTKPWGADGDHLKHAQQITEALNMNCSMITADLSDAIHSEYLTDDADIDAVEAAYAALDSEYRAYLEDSYTERAIAIDHDYTVAFSAEDTMRIALTYSDAVIHARALYTAMLAALEARDHSRRDNNGRDDGVRDSGGNKKIDFEISIDETAVSTTPQAHYFVANELRRKQVVFTALAPRFCGEFQKGIDYIGDLNAFAADLESHRRIANHFSYKLSIHSGSDKFTVFPIIGATLQSFHIKTSGTNWLTALKTIAEVNPALFRTLHQKAYDVFDVARQHYHITPDLSTKMDIHAMEDSELPAVLDNPCDRQIVHIAYGEIFKDGALKKDIDTTLHTHLTRYWDNIHDHIGKHLAPLMSAHRR